MSLLKIVGEKLPTLAKIEFGRIKVIDFIDLFIDFFTFLLID